MLKKEIRQRKIDMAFKPLVSVGQGQQLKVISTALPEEEAQQVRIYLAKIDRQPAWWLRKLIREELARIDTQGKL